MTYASKHMSWIGLMGLTGLTLALAGCPGDDDGDTGAETGPAPTTEATVGNETTAGEDTATVEPTTTTVDPDTSTTGPVTCTPACTASEECIDGVCVDTSDDTTGDPPLECGLPPGLMFPTPACGTCAEASCCEQLQVCFGDETTTEPSDCLELNNCVVMSCATAMTLPDLQACVEENCAEYAGELNNFLAYQACVGMNCAAACS